MVVDDLHSAPRDTLTLLRHLAQRLSAFSVLTMLTYGTPSYRKVTP